MRKIFIILFIFISSVFASGNAFATGEGCPSGYGEAGKDFCKVIRVGDDKYFYDTLTNSSSSAIKIKGVDWTFVTQNGYKYNGGENPSFVYTDWIIDKKGIIGEGETGNIVISTPVYEIKYRPEVRSYENLTITYDVKYVSYIDNEEVGDIKNHEEIAHYAISWCGDGILDEQYGEVCDPNDSSREGFGNLGCSSSCQPINSICGNGVKEASEECDPADTSRDGWGNKGCDENCNALTGPTCDQTFNNKLRYGYSYTFDDYFKNSGTDTLKLKQVVPSFRERLNFNGDDSMPTWKYSDYLKSKNYNISPGEEGMLVYSTIDTKYNITYYPGDGRNDQYDDVNVIYTSSYTKLIDGQQRGYFIHTECDNYEVTWCGDGTRDDYYERNGFHVYEECDPNDPNRVGWGNGGCSNDCHPVENESVCNGLEYNPDKNPIIIGEDNTTKTVTCRATNATTIKIDCGNGDSQEFSGNTSGEKIVSKECNYTKAGTYNPTCYVNNTITNNSCKDELVVLDSNSSEPEIEVIKTDYNDVDKDGHKGNDTQTINTGDKAVFKIIVNNIGGEDLKNIYLTDALVLGCSRTKNEVKNIIGGDGILKVGESFSYVCETANPKSDLKKVGDKYINEITVNGEGVDDGKNVSDDDDTKVIIDENTIINPEIEVIKTDYNDVDKDGNKGDDTQTINTGDKAVFEIIVKNTGNEDLKNIYLTDSLVSGCSKTKEEVKSIIGGEGILGVGETFHYYCETTNPKSDLKKVGDKYVNEVTVNGEGVNDGKNVNDNDDTEVIIEENNNEEGCNGLEYSPDKNPITIGEDDTTKIVSCTATNTSIIKIDCGNGVSQEFSGDTNGTKIVSKECSYTKAGVYYPTCYVDNNETNTSCKKDLTVLEGDGGSPAIDVEKTDYNDDDKDGNKGDDTQTINTGDKAVFKIIVTNVGSEDLKNIYLVDDLAPECSKTKEEVKALVGGDILSVGSSFSYLCTVENPETKLKKVGDKYVNEVTVNGEGVDNGQSVNDNNDTDVIIDNDNSNLQCQSNVTGPQDTPITTSTPGLCSNSGEEVVDFESNQVGTTTNYTWSCKDSNDVVHTGGNCSASYTNGGGGGGGGGGDGDTYKCLDIELSGNTVTCIGNEVARAFGVICDTSSGSTADKIDLFKKYSVVDNSNIHYANFSCSVVNNPICYVYNNEHQLTYGGKAWVTSTSCQYTPGQNCGNGIIEGTEECERGEDGTFPDFCDPTDCSLKDNGGGSSDPDSHFSTIPVHDGNLTTEPSQGEIGFVGLYDMILGHGQNLGDRLNGQVYIWNNSPYTFSNSVFNGICLTTNDISGQHNTGDSLSNVGIDQHCTPITTYFYPGQKIYLNSDLSDIVANKYKIDTGKDYEDNKMVVTIKTTKIMNPYPQVLNWSDHLTGKFRVRVSKPSIMTTGGTSYNKTAGGNTQKIAEDNGIKIEGQEAGINNNDVGVGTMSSDASITTDSSVVNDAQNYISSSSLTTIETDFENYNGLDNVLIKKGDVKMNDIINDYSLSSIAKPVTFIIDSGDLTIDTDLKNVPQNIAFVVKNGGNIIINNNVKEIQGTYIVLGIGKIKSDGIDTSNILTIKGSLYGDSSDLVDHRINVQEDNGELTFGTLVSFGSHVFKKPAPLVTKFINEYLETTKVAQ